MNSINGNPTNWAAPADTTHAADRVPPRLYDICGLLTVQHGMTPSAQEKAQFEHALRALDRTQVGAALLRDIKACDIPPDKRPVCIFHGQDPYEDSASAVEQAEPDGAPIIHFPTLPPDADVNGEAHAHRLIDLFADLVEYYGTSIGKPCSMLGFEPYRMSTFREQIGYPMQQWQIDMQAYAEEAADSSETVDRVMIIVVDWVSARNPQAELRLMDLGLTRCPPLSHLPGLTAVDLGGNRLTAFPPADRLPPAVQTVNLAGNPLRDGAERYSPSLRRVTLGGADCDVQRLKTFFPSAIEIVEQRGGATPTSRPETLTP